jgi:hypothetical protein
MPGDFRPTPGDLTGLATLIEQIPLGKFYRGRVAIISFVPPNPKIPSPILKEAPKSPKTEQSTLE